jgi:ABC-type uncharacterized transport system ATPase subunit
VNAAVTVPAVVAPRVALQKVSKSFGPVQANQDVDLELRRGEVHAIVGENGAGKSTLMSILYGSLRPDSGTVRIDGAVTQFRSPADAIAANIGMVHQHFQLFDEFTVWENIVYGAEPGSSWRLRADRARQSVAHLLEAQGLPIDPNSRIKTLPMGTRQQVEICKALYRGADVLILDEPTAVLTSGETDSLLTSLREMALHGSAVVLVTHKLDEVMRVADRVTVMRHGEVVFSCPTNETDPEALSLAMTGKRIVAAVNNEEVALAGHVLEIRDLHLPASQAGVQLNCERLTVSAGEIVGIAGVAGNGQSELVEAIVGLRRGSGTQLINGIDVSRDGVRQRRQAGMAYVPEDRKHVGTAGTMSIQDNLILGHHRSSSMRSGISGLSAKAMSAYAGALVETFDVRGGALRNQVTSLSGGNAQKVVIARELAHDAMLLIAENPTQGVDIGAIEFIHQRLLEYRRSGHGTLLISNELSELCALADRVLVMVRGSIVREFARSELSEEAIGRVMTNAVSISSSPLQPEAADADGRELIAEEAIE